MNQFPLKHSANAEQQQRQQSRYSPMHVQHWQQHKKTAAFSSVVADGVSPCCSLASGCCVTTSTIGAVSAADDVLSCEATCTFKWKKNTIGINQDPTKKTKRLDVFFYRLLPSSLMLRLWGNTVRAWRSFTPLMSTLNKGLNLERLLSCSRQAMRCCAVTFFFFFFFLSAEFRKKKLGIWFFFLNLKV